MPLLVSDITPKAAARLNDFSQTVYTNAVQLPYVADAWDELKIALDLNGALVIEEISAVLILPIGQTNFVTAGIQPSNLLEPLNLLERLSGSSDLFTSMTKRQWEPEVLPTDSLRYWVWREQEIKVIGALTIRDVKIQYNKALIDITSVGDSLDVNHCKQFMINRVAGFLALFIANNPNRAKVLNDKADLLLQQLLGINGRSKQGNRLRRKPWRMNSRARLT